MLHSLYPVMLCLSIVNMTIDLASLSCIKYISNEAVVPALEGLLANVDLLNPLRIIELTVKLLLATDL